MIVSFRDQKKPYLMETNELHKHNARVPLYKTIQFQIHTSQQYLFGCERQTPLDRYLLVELYLLCRTSYNKYEKQIKKQFKRGDIRT